MKFRVPCGEGLCTGQQDIICEKHTSNKVCILSVGPGLRAN